MRFLADMGISPVSVKCLNEEGHDAVHLADEKLHQLPDKDVFNKARNENRILLTTDLDFGEIALSEAPSSTSVIIFRQEDRTPYSINQYLEKVINTKKAEIGKGVILIVQENRFRIRYTE